MLKLQGKSVLVSGGAGFIGSHLVDRLLLEEPSRITVVDNFFLGREENLQDAVAKNTDLAVRRLDASDLAAMQDVVSEREVDVVFDLAIVPLPTSLHYPVWTAQTNIGIATTFCELARRGLIDTLVHCSSSETYGTARGVPMSEDHPQDAITPYAASKSAADSIITSYVKTFGIDAVIVRPFNNFGPRQNPGSYAGIIPIVIHRVAEGIPVEITGDGEQTRDFIYVKETVDLILRAYEVVESRGLVINVATGIETSINTLVRELLEVLGAENHPIVHTPERAGDVRRHCADITRAKTLLDLHPHPLSKTQLKETIDYYLGEKALNGR
ncbi:UDP-glucose 4-epimerase [Phycicoccus badiiscoriae]|uniref:UDP-glucose 4-epimerase n=1 Tax=Pedococcus badiiscoriae TaxID=642776 RepID=A0A852WLM0_9MICO|nr:UDP-glucose 4-epimerase [Pedococcus badiiscoriae]